MKTNFKVGQRVWVSPQLTGKTDWIEATITEVEHNPFVGIVIEVRTDAGEFFFEKEYEINSESYFNSKEDMFKPLEALELCTL